MDAVTNIWTLLRLLFVVDVYEVDLPALVVVPAPRLPQCLPVTGNDAARGSHHRAVIVVKNLVNRTLINSPARARMHPVSSIRNGERMLLAIKSGTLSCVVHSFHQRARTGTPTLQARTGSLANVSGIGCCDRLCAPLSFHAPSNALRANAVVGTIMSATSESIARIITFMLSSVGPLALSYCRSYTTVLFIACPCAFFPLVVIVRVLPSAEMTVF